LSIYTTTLSQPSGRSFIAFVYRDSDKSLLNSSNAIFEAVVLTDLQGNARIPYRHQFQERTPGSYYSELDVSSFLDGSYTIEAREISNGIEYSNVLTSSFLVSGGSVAPTNVFIKIKTQTARSIFAYIRSASSKKFLNSTTQSMGILDLLSSSLEARSVFRHSFTETSPSNYSLTLDSSILDDGVYEVLTYELVGDIEIEAGEAHIFRIQDGKQLDGVDFGTIKMNENTGGKDVLRYTKSNGEGVSGASVSVYLSLEYNQGNLANPIGKTTTGSDGRWHAPISVDAGTTYTVVFQKSGYFGPDSAEVVL